MGQASDNDSHIDLTQRVCRLIEKHSEEPLTLTDLGQYFEVSPAHLQRVFKKVMGVTPRQYADACRVDVLKSELKERETVTMAMLEAGYGSSSRLYERSTSQLGMTPATYKRGGRGMNILYTIAECSLGRLLLAATEEGISAIYLGDQDGPMEECLREEYPAAKIARAERVWEEWLTEVLAHLEGERPHLDLPLDVRATAFQRRVWEELQKIPYGSTRTYKQVAEAIGSPSAVRAVGRACATNPVSVVIPCHRVLRGDGSLGGYRWGLDKKQALLDYEREQND